MLELGPRVLRSDETQAEPLVGRDDGVAEDTAERLAGVEVVVVALDGRECGKGLQHDGHSKEQFGHNLEFLGHHRVRPGVLHPEEAE